jgi:hypothetical protein
MSDNPLHALNRSKIALLTTYKRDGTAVSTPVSVVVDRDGTVAYIRTYSHTGKAKRLRRNPAVLAAPATFRGKPLGPAIPCVAQLLEGDAAARASRRMSRHSPVIEGLAVPLTARLRKYTMLHYAITFHSPLRVSAAGPAGSIAQRGEHQQLHVVDAHASSTRARRHRSR